MLQALASALAGRRIRYVLRGKDETRKLVRRRRREISLLPGPFRASDLRDVHCDSQRSAFFTCLSDADFDMVAQNVAFELGIMR
jgi:hypothetical protein